MLNIVCGLEYVRGALATDKKRDFLTHVFARLRKRNLSMIYKNCTSFIHNRQMQKMTTLARRFGIDIWKG